jgi:hypothetical protein
MFKGTVSFRARIKGNGLSFPLCDFNPNEAQGQTLQPARRKDKHSNPRAELRIWRARRSSNRPTEEPLAAPCRYFRLSARVRFGRAMMH